MERGWLLSLPVLKVRVPRGGRWEHRRVDKAARLLYRQGVRRVLPLREFERWDILNARGLWAVDALPLYRAMAAQLVLAALAGRGEDPRNAAVVLRGDHVDAELAAAARKLCPLVRHLAVDTQRGGRQLCRELYWQYGAAVEPGQAGQDWLSVRFNGENCGEDLVLCAQPRLMGLEVYAPGLAVPEELEQAPLLTALWQAGLLSAQQIRIVPNKFS
ncbi:MAG: hypothetical protein J6A62_05075 [Oscillospiraceae bacterium]|nr:hypothetical protein [Oscillospiraceae bacterium]